MESVQIFDIRTQLLTAAGSVNDASRLLTEGDIDMESVQIFELRTQLLNAAGHVNGASRLMTETDVYPEQIEALDDLFKRIMEVYFAIRLEQAG